MSHGFRMNTFTRLIRQMLYKVQYTFKTLFYTSLFVLVCIYSCFENSFFEKITSACKKLNNDSQHKNCVYTFSSIFDLYKC